MGQAYITNLLLRVKERLIHHKNLVNNFSYLSLLQGFNVLFPIITYPYLIKTIGIELYGLVIFAQVIAGYFGIFIDFGQKISATKLISISHDNPLRISKIVSSVIVFKCFLWIISLGAILICITFFSSNSQLNNLILFSFGICFNEFLFPQWYYQGMEKMKYITILNVLSKVIFMTLIFLFVNHKDNYLLIPVLNAIGALVGGVIGLYIMFFKEKVKFIFPSFPEILSLIKESYPLFLSSIVISVKDRLNIVFIGSSLGMAQVAIYDLGIKIMSFFIQPIDIINSTIYPKVAKEKNMDFVKKVTKWSFIGMIILVVMTFPLLPLIINYIGDGINGALLPIQILLLSPIVLSLSLPLARNCLIIYGKYKIVLVGMTLTTIFYLFLIALGNLTNSLDNVLAFSIITLCVYIFELVYRLIIIKKYKITPLFAT